VPEAHEQELADWFHSKLSAALQAQTSSTSVIPLISAQVQFPFSSTPDVGPDGVHGSGIYPDPSADRTGRTGCTVLI